MRRVGVSLIGILTLLGSVLAASAAGSSPACESSLPPNIAPGMLQQQMIMLLERSATFRDQCRRIAAAPHVRIRFDVGVQIAGGGRAETDIYRYQAGAIAAFVTVRFAEDYLELIPHELEHIIEQIEGVRLTEELAASRAWMVPSGGYETRRAMNAGARVRQELEALAVEPIQHEGVKAPATRNPFR